MRSYSDETTNYYIKNRTVAHSLPGFTLISGGPPMSPLESTRPYEPLSKLILEKDIQITHRGSPSYKSLIHTSPLEIRCSPHVDASTVRARPTVNARMGSLRGIRGRAASIFHGVSVPVI